MNINLYNKRMQQRKQRVRKKLRAVAGRPRLHVFRSNHYIYAQIIDDTKGHTVASATEKELKKKTGTKSERAAQLGQLIAQKAQKKGVVAVAFDRGSYQYAGRVKALAEAARQEGLEF